MATLLACMHFAQTILLNMCVILWEENIVYLKLVDHKHTLHCQITLTFRCLHITSVLLYLFLGVVSATSLANPERQC